MTIRRCFLVLVIFLVAPVVSYASDPGDLFLYLAEGDVQMKTADSDDWVPAASNTPLFEGDKLWVPYDGRAEIRSNDGTSVRLGYGAALEIGPPQDEGQHYYLDQGRCYVNFQGSGGRPITIDAPDASVRTYDAAVFKIDAPEDGETVVSVLSGALSVGAQAEQIDLQGGQRLILRDRGAFPDVARLAPDDEWGHWNRERDREAYGAGKGYSAQYLPEGLRIYASDFDRNGTWEIVPDYGRVWVPAAVVSPGWSPYRIGRWVWMRGDYVWVSYEPWGWAPYHYGRWAYVGRIGWCWVPPSRGAVYWGPGYVGWVYTGTLVSWVPLAPREVYYGRGYHGPDSVDTTRYKDRRPGMNITYRNVHVKDGVTTINRDAFLMGKGAAPAHARENPFLKERPSFGAPPIKPVRTTLMPTVRDIPPAKRPPERIREAKSLSPAQNERQRGPGGPAPLSRKGPGQALSPEQRRIGSPVERSPMPAQGPASAGRPGGPQTSKERSREPVRQPGDQGRPGPASSGGPTGGRPQTIAPPAPRDQRPPSTGPVAPSGRQAAPVEQPRRETMGAPVGNQPPQAGPGITPRQGEPRVPGPPAGQTQPGTRDDEQGRMERRSIERPQGGQPRREAPPGQGTGTGLMREAPAARVPGPQRQTAPAPQMQTRPAPQPAAAAPSRPAPQIQQRPAPQPAAAAPRSRPAPQIQTKPIPQSAPQAQPRPAPQIQAKPAPQPQPAQPSKASPGSGRLEPKRPGSPADRGRQSTQKGGRERPGPDQSGPGR